MSGAKAVQARVALVLLVGTLVVTQPLSTVVGDYFLDNVIVATGTHHSWRTYDEQRGAPDVLVVGDSRVGNDIDPEHLASVLSARAGRRLSVQVLSFGGVKLSFLDALIHRVMERRWKPKLVVLTASEFQFNDRSYYDPTADLWQVSDPYDLDFMRAAYRVDPHRETLVEGWAVPLVPNSKFITEGLREEAAARVPPLRWLLGVDGTNGVPLLHGYDRSHPMSDDIERSTLEAFADQPFHLRDYRFSTTELGYLEDAARTVLGAGATLQLLVLPVYRIDAINPAGYRIFLDGIEAVARRIEVSLADLHADPVTSDRSLWNDPSHLSLPGARAFEPRLVAALRALQ